MNAIMQDVFVAPNKEDLKVSKVKLFENMTKSKLLLHPMKLLL